VVVTVSRAQAHPQSLPTVLLTPQASRGRALIVHGYGGCKEEMLGLAWRVAERGFTTAAIDLRGHGENPWSYDSAILDDVEFALRNLTVAGPVVAIGHSLGGRLCLLSSADFKVGLSPALARQYSPMTEGLIRDMRAHSVRESHPGINSETLAALPSWDGCDRDHALILYGSRDVPEIRAGCEDLQGKSCRVQRVDGAVHGDIYLNSITLSVVGQQLEAWFGS